MLDVLGMLFLFFASLTVMWCVWRVFALAFDVAKCKQQIKRRLGVFVWRRRQWCCKQCRTWFYGVPQDGPVCDACKWKAYLEYLEKVA